MKSLAIIIIILLFLSVEATASEACSLNKKIQSILIKKGLDFRTKSTKGWIRFLNNNDKCYIYHISKEEKKILMLCLYNYSKKLNFGRLS